MAPQLRLVSPERGPEPLASFRADARLRLWGAGLCACGAIAMTAAGYHRTLSALLAGPVAAAFVLWSLYLLATFTVRRAVRYTLTPQRLEVERGILGKRYESIDLWRGGGGMLGPTPLESARGGGRVTPLSPHPPAPQPLVGPVAPPG